MNVLVVVPTYNERENLPLWSRASWRTTGSACWSSTTGRRTGPARWPTPGRDIPAASRSSTARAARPRTLVHRRPAACARRTDAELICQMDADLSHDPEYLPDIAPRAATYDVVIGSRYLNGVSVVNWPLRRIFLSAFANRYIRAVTRLRPPTAPAATAAGAARCSRAAAARPRRVGRLRVPGRDALRGARRGAASAKCRSSSSSAGKASRSFVEPSCSSRWSRRGV